MTRPPSRDAIAEVGIGLSGDASTAPHLEEATFVERVGQPSASGSSRAALVDGRVAVAASACSSS